MAQIKFYYSIANLFKRLRMESLHRSGALKLDGEKQYEDYAIVGDDLNYIQNTLLKDASKRVFSKLASMSKAISNAYQYMESDLSSTPSIDESGYVCFFVTEPTNWDDNVTELMDGEIEQAMINYVIMEWFKRKGLDYRQIQQEFLENCQTLVNYKHRRTEHVTRNQKPF